MVHECLGARDVAHPLMPHPSSLMPHPIHTAHGTEDSALGSRHTTRDSSHECLGARNVAHPLMPHPSCLMPPHRYTQRPAQTTRHSALGTRHYPRSIIFMNSPNR